MKEALLITSVFDRLSGSSNNKPIKPEDYTIEDYEELLDEYKRAEAEVLINIATIYFEKENIPESIKNLEKAIKEYNKLGDISKLALVYDLMGDVNRYNKKIDIAIDNYKKAYKLYFKINSKNKDEIKEKINDSRNSPISWWCRNNIQY